MLPQILEWWCFMDDLYKEKAFYSGLNWYNNMENFDNRGKE